MSKVTKKDLKAVAKDLNKVVGAEPPIDLDSDDESLTVGILEAAALLVPDDNIEEVTTKVLTALKAPGFESTEEEEEEKEVIEKEEKKKTKKPKTAPKLKKSKPLVKPSKDNKSPEKKQSSNKKAKKAAVPKPKSKAVKEHSASKRDFSKSTKAILFQEWKKHPKRSPEDFHKGVAKAVKLSTIRAWLNRWAYGANFPAGEGGKP